MHSIPALGVGCILDYRGEILIKLLVVEDDINTRKLMKVVLSSDGYEPILANNAEEALEKLESFKIDLIVMDIMMPGMDGFELTKKLRLDGCMIPILMVTAKETPMDVKHGFITGTDDYMVKPVDEDEMLLRIAALLRRSKINNERKIEIESVILDYDTLSVARGEEVVTLPQKEFQILFKLLSYPNQIFTRVQIMDDFWGLESESDPHTVDVHINRIRNRFNKYNEFEIVTIRGLGYKAVRKV